MNVLDLSRVQFGDTAAFHILWPVISIGLALYMFCLECWWLYTKDDRYYRQVRFWSKIFVLTFGIGTASGIPLEFEFGTNWAAFSSAAGDFFGNILGFESTVAFALEAAFLAIFIFGWKRVRPSVHLFANAMVLLGAVLSAFWIMAANSWMQVPLGVVVVDGKLVVTDYIAAIFNPDTIVSFLHMTVACVETTLFMMMGICALALLLNTQSKQFFLDAFKYCLVIAVFATPLQIGLGDASGLVVAQYQPEKLAALELHWQTNQTGQGAAWSIVAWPNGNGGNSFDIAIPNALSLLVTHSPQGVVQGLNAFPPSDEPSLLDDTLTYYSFRAMVAIGFILFFLMLWGLWQWRQGALAVEKIFEHKKFLWAFVWSIPLGFIATEAGWIVREVGRQPWIVYHLMRVGDGLSSGLNAPEVAATTAIFTAIYLFFIVLFIYFTYKIVLKGPEHE